MSLPEPPDLTRLEFEHWTDVYAAWRDDESSRRAGWTYGDGGKVWCLYGETVPQTWTHLIETYGEESLTLAVRLVPHPDDAAKRGQWPTEIYFRKGLREPRPRRPRRSRAAEAES